MKVTEKTPEFLSIVAGQYDDKERVPVMIGQAPGDHEWSGFSSSGTLRKIGLRKSSPKRSRDQDARMPSEERYIDMRLAGIESKLDARMDAMQRFQEKAEDRFQRATERHETDIALARQQIHQEFKDAARRMSDESAASRKHSTNTAWATVGGVFAVMAIIVALFAYWITEQGSYAKSYGENQVQMQQAADERAEFREAVKSIQGTQQSILDRLPPERTTSPQQ